MERNLELVKSILEKVESFEPFTKIQEFSIDGFDLKNVYYHVKILAEAGYLSAQEINKKVWLPYHLTWAGHEFLDSLRNERAIKKIKDKFGNDLSKIPFEVLKVLIAESIKAIFQG